MPSLVIRDHSGTEVERIDVTGKTDRQIERIESGILINMDRDRFTVGEED